VKSQTQIVLVGDLCGYRFIDNLEEDIIREHGCLPYV
jgi:hypothetical protein